MFVKEVITPHPQTLKQHDPLIKAANFFVQTENNCIPVVSDVNEPIGILTVHQLVNYLSKKYTIDDEVREAMQHELLTVFEDLEIHDMLQMPIERAIVVDNQGKFSGLITRSNIIYYLYHKIQQLQGELEAFLDLDSIIESSYDGIIILDREKILKVNKSFERISGLKAENLIGLYVHELDKKVHICLESIKTVFNYVLTEQKPYTVLRKVGDNDVYVTGNPVFDTLNNKLSHIILNIRDVTELQVLREKVEAAEKLSQRYKTEAEELRSRLMVKEDLVFESEQMQKIVELVLRVAKVDSSVIILGESGVGKEVIARLIHRLSPRAHRPFIQINCGAIPENLLESELFGFEGGSFTGAKKEGKPGLFELADKGILFLDEIADLPKNLQVKLLRAIQNQEIYRIGGVKPIKLDIRIITATNKDLNELVQNGSFREDLYYRLSVIPIYIPPLRERRKDILPLINYFVNRFNEKYNFKKTISGEVYHLLETYDWPGNVRELQNIIERILVLNDSDVIRIEHIPSNLLEKGQVIPKSKIRIEGILPLLEAKEYVERELIERAIDGTGSIREAAQLLGIDHSTCIRKMQKYGLKSKLKVYQVF